jgi:hypothetical protein
MAKKGLRLIFLDLQVCFNMFVVMYLLLASKPVEKTYRFAKNEGKLSVYIYRL